MPGRYDHSVHYRSGCRVNYGCLKLARDVGSVKLGSEAVKIVWPDTVPDTPSQADNGGSAAHYHTCSSTSPWLHSAQIIARQLSASRGSCAYAKGRPP